MTCTLYWESSSGISTWVVSNSMSQHSTDVRVQGELTTRPKKSDVVTMETLTSSTLVCSSNSVRPRPLPYVFNLFYDMYMNIYVYKQLRKMTIHNFYVFIAFGKAFSSDVTADGPPSRVQTSSNVSENVW